MKYLGDFQEDQTIYIPFTTNDANGGRVGFSSSLEANDFQIYKDNNVAQKTSDNGITINETFDSVTGLHLLVIDTSNDTGDAGFWTTGSDYFVVLYPNIEQVDGQDVTAVVGHFSIENRYTALEVGPKLPTNNIMGSSTKANKDDEIDSILADTGELQTDWANGGRLDLIVDAILADTNELQGDWVNGGRLDLILDAIQADTNELQTDWTNGGRLDLIIDAIQADTNELQTDWTDGGRLDLLLDGVKTKTDALPSGIRKNTAFANFTFPMIDSADDKSYITGRSVVAQRRLDNGAFGSCDNGVTEVSNGFYSINLTAADLNGDTVTLLFTAAGANATAFTFKTET